MRSVQIRSICCILVPLLLLLFGALFFLYTVNDYKVQATYRESALSRVRMADSLVRLELSSVVSDIQWLSCCQEAQSAVAGSMSRDDCTSLVRFCRNRRLYDQIRYVDITGMELFRVNFNCGNPYMAGPGSLQFKGGRYYIAEGLKLMAGDIYISPFDLNVEHGQIEKPFKPMIRFVTPVLDDRGSRQGLAVVNYLGQRLLDVFDCVPGKDLGCLMLLNEDGYWLKCHNAENEWGFMFADRKHLTFQAKHPEAWSQIASNKKGQFMTDAGLYTFSTIRLADVILNNQVENPEHCAGTWKIICHIDRDTYFKEQGEYAERLAYVGAPGALFLGAISLFAAHYINRSRKAEKSIIEHDASFARFVPKEFLRLVGKGA